jgi:hypothetical protein
MWLLAVLGVSSTSDISQTQRACEEWLYALPRTLVADGSTIQAISDRTLVLDRLNSHDEEGVPGAECTVVSIERKCKTVTLVTGLVVGVIACRGHG